MARKAGVHKVTQVMVAAMKRNALLDMLFVLGILVIRLVPVYFVCSRGVVTAVDADPLLYFGGAREILLTGINPHNYFPPLQFLLVAACLRMGGGSTTVPLAAIAVVGWLTVVVLFLLARELWGRKEARLVLFISGLYPNFIYYGVSFYPETLAVFFIMVSFFMMIKYRKDVARVGYLIVSGCAWGLAAQTRGGLHFFAPVMAWVIARAADQPRRTAGLKAAMLFLLAVYGTVVAAGLAARPVQGEFSFNARSGIASVVHGANRIAPPCTDYGDVRGNIFYEINLQGERWPEGVQLYSEEIWKQGTAQILGSVLAFILQDPLRYLGNSLKKLSCFWSPNQMVIKWLKLRYFHQYGILIEGICLAIAVVYMLVVCGGLGGMAQSADSFRPIAVLFIIFYALLVFFTVGNSKLRFPLMPLFMLYCAYFIARGGSGAGWWRARGSRLGLALLAALFIGNGAYKYQEILLSPDEVRVRQIELLSELGFPQTALRLLTRQESCDTCTADQKQRLRVAARRARAQVQGGE